MAAPVAFWTSGEHGIAVVMFFSFVLDSSYIPGCLGQSRTPESVQFAPPSSSFTPVEPSDRWVQVLLSVSAAAQGIDGLETYPRIRPALTFSVVLPLAWMFLIGVFDASAVDHHAATKLRSLPPIFGDRLWRANPLEFGGDAAEQGSEQAGSKFVMYGVLCGASRMTSLGASFVPGKRSPAPPRREAEPAGDWLFDIPGA